ncbi:crosslink repair DNA glycosylase YcaQ family protein [Curtobacterium flaccumfaciens]|nr:crosslink repair DNA glycosylase YcaQ family protein [Curtobacterium flaccumfaciens]
MADARHPARDAARRPAAAALPDRRADHPRHRPSRGGPRRRRRRARPRPGRHGRDAVRRPVPRPRRAVRCVPGCGPRPGGRPRVPRAAPSGAGGDDRLGSHRQGRAGVVLLDEWAPARAEPPDRDDALGRVLVGYLRGRGPATETDAAAWTKLPLADVRRARAAAGDAVEGLGEGLLALADRPATGGTPIGHLLPGFDEYLLGYADRSAQLDPAHADRVVPGGNGMFLPMAVVRGRVVGTWARSERSRDVRVTVTPFAPLDPAATRALETAAARYGAFLAAPVTFSVA